MNRPRDKRNPYADFTRAERERYMQRCVTRRWERKQRLVELSGGRCVRCGYDKCLRALSFHHRDPASKSFTLESRTLAAKPWETIVAEAGKCDLLCANCHMEVEHARTPKYSRC